MSSSDSAKQSCAEFLALNHPIDTQRWQLALTARVSGGRGSLFGGVGLAAGIVALEHATNKPVIWATGQYLSLTQLDEQLDLEVILPAIGRNVVQGRVVGHVGDREVITVIGAAGSRSSAAEGCWETFPSPAPAEDCPLVPHGHGNESLHEPGQHDPLRSAGTNRLGALRQPHGIRRQRLRPWHRALMERVWHAAGDREPVHDRPQPLKKEDPV